MTIFVLIYFKANVIQNTNFSKPKFLWHNRQARSGFQGKTEYFASVCPDVDWEKDGIVVVHIEANFLAQIYGSDHIAVQTAVTEIGTKSFHLAQRVIDTETQEVKCVCTSVMVAFDLAKHESKPLEEKWIEAICKYEGKDLKKKK